MAVHSIKKLYFQITLPLPAQVKDLKRWTEYVKFWGFPNISKEKTEDTNPFHHTKSKIDWLSVTDSRYSSPNYWYKKIEARCRITQNSLNLQFSESCLQIYSGADCLFHSILIS